MGSVSEPDSAERFSKVMASMPGFRFHPTDEELIMYYLKRKMRGKKLNLDVIPETDVYKWDPEELPGQSVLKTGDRQWFFFCHRDRKYPNCTRSSRGTKHGYWKATGKDRNVSYNARAVGVKKTLVFYRGRAPNGQRTDWVMHEYTITEEELRRCQGVKDYYALYKLFKKSGPGPRNGEQYGAPFIEEEWEDKFVDFNAGREVPNTDIVNDPLQPLCDDEIEDIIKGIFDDEPVNDMREEVYPEFPQAVAEETQSTVVDQFSEAVLLPEPNGMFLPSSQHYHVQPSSNLNRSISSPSYVYEAPEVNSAPANIQREVHFRDDDFFELNDLLSTDSTLSNTVKPVENLQFEDGLSELDLYHDAEMFLNDWGPITQEPFTHSYMNASDSNIQNQNYQLLPNQEDANQNSHERNILNQAEGFVGSFSQPTPGIVYEFANDGHENRSSTAEDVATSSFSAALWNFVESIPTTPASAAENALVNRALNRMSSFSRVKINLKQTNVAAGNDTTAATVRIAGRKGVSFLFLPIIIALCAFLWVSVGTLRSLGRCISP